MVMPKWMVALLMLAFNTAGGLSAMELFHPGSKGAIGLVVASMVLGNALAMFGVPMAGKAAAQPELPPVKP